MKPLLIACLCLIPWLTSACKPSTQNMLQQSSLSHNQAVDIQNDISRLHNLSQRQNQESAIFQQEALPAIRSGNSLQIAQIIEDMQQRVHKFNSELENLLLSSAEVDSIRKKMMQSNQLSLQLAQQGAAKRPDTQKIIQLQQEIEQNQQQISHLTQNAQAKISQAANMS